MSFAKTQYMEKAAKLAKTEKAIESVTGKLRAAEAVQNAKLQEAMRPIREQAEELQKKFQQTFSKENAVPIGKLHQLESRKERLEAQLKKFADAEILGDELPEDDASLKDIPSDVKLDEEIEGLAAEADAPVLAEVN